MTQTTIPPGERMSLQHLNFEEQTHAKERVMELDHWYRSFLDSHVEYREVLHEFMQALLIHKPYDTLEFMKTYFQAHAKDKTKSS